MGVAEPIWFQPCRHAGMCSHLSPAEPSSVTLPAHSTGQHRGSTGHVSPSNTLWQAPCPRSLGQTHPLQVEVGVVHQSFHHPHEVDEQRQAVLRHVNMDLGERGTPKSVGGCHKGHPTFGDTPGSPYVLGTPLGLTPSRMKVPKRGSNW